MKTLFTSFLLLTVHAATAQTIQPAKKSWALPNVDSIYKGTEYVSFEVTMLDGKKINNETCKGKVTFIDFWFESCAGCRGEIKELNALYDSIKNNPSYQFIAVTFDDPATLPDFLKENGIHYPVATVASSVEAHRLNYRQGFPSKVIIDKDGKIAYIGMSSIGNNDVGFSITMKRILSTMSYCAK